MSNDRFEGWYFKHQIGDETIAFIPGRARANAFLQVITRDGTRQFDFPTLSQGDRRIGIGHCTFGEDGMAVDLPGICGALRYGPLEPLDSDIMGPFRFLPMDCRHGVISMGHDLRGTLLVDGRSVDFSGGRGYIERDCGGSFPKNYLWLQCNAFAQLLSVMLAVAYIPVGRLHFTGCICAIVHAGREYRLATYCGVKILRANEQGVVLTQGAYRLQIEIENGCAHPLKAPLHGRMTGMVHECNAAHARFRFFENNQLIFDEKSDSVSFECVKSLALPCVRHCEGNGTL
ncbi:MAG: tocopherol cyclase family protein [Clostridia bacterium]